MRTSVPVPPPSKTIGDETTFDSLPELLYDEARFESSEEQSEEETIMKEPICPYAAEYSDGYRSDSEKSYLSDEDDMDDISDDDTDDELVMRGPGNRTVVKIAQKPKPATIQPPPPPASASPPPRPASGPPAPAAHLNHTVATATSKSRQTTSTTGSRKG